MNLNYSIKQRLTSLCKTASVITIIMGILILVGWILNYSILISPSSNYAPTTLSSSLCFILIGISIFSLQKRNNVFDNTIPRILPLIVISIAGVALLDHIFRYTINSSYMGTYFGFLGLIMLRMSIVTAISFILVASAILLIDSKIYSKYNFHQYLAEIVFFIMYLIILGYIYQTNVFELSSTIQPSIYGTIIFSIISLGLLCLRPYRGLIGVLYSGRVSGKFGRDILPLILLLPLIIGELMILGQLNGLYDIEFGIALMVFFTTVILFIVISKSMLSIDNVDIMRLKTEQELKNANIELERSNKELESFAYITSHDLQEPLRTMGNYAGLIKRRYEGKLDDDADEFLEYMVSGAIRMQKMIHSILKYSRIDSKESTFRSFNSRDTLMEALANLKDSIEEHNAEVIIDPLPVIYADKNLIVLVFQNLISNALKFKKGLKPKIHVSARKDNDEYIFSIQDNGIGIEKQYFKQIFEVFGRLHPIGEYEGVGIGLATVNKIINRHEGRIWAESELGKGSTFYFTIPIRKN